LITFNDISERKLAEKALQEKNEIITHLAVTASFGVAQLKEGQDDDALMRRVDAHSIELSMRSATGW